MAARALTSEADVARLAQALRAGERAQLARAITLVESRRADHQQTARQLVQMLLPATGQAMRVGNACHVAGGIEMPNDAVFRSISVAAANGRQGTKELVKGWEVAGAILGKPFGRRSRAEKH